MIEGKSTIQGLLSIEPRMNDLFVEMHLIENAPHNLGENKHYLGVASNLVIFACKRSFELGFDGFVAFTAKTKLISHYIESIGAQVIYGNECMGIFTPAAKKVNSYYKISFMGDKKKYYKLDEVGIVGKQEKKSAASQKYHSQKTGKIFQAARATDTAQSTKK